MTSRLRWRIVVTLGVTLMLSISLWYPALAAMVGLPVPEFVRARRLALGLDLRGGTHMVLKVHVDDAVGRQVPRADRQPDAGELARLRTEIVTRTREIVERRVDELGVTEPVVAIQGRSGDEIFVQLPGISDMNRARAILGATAVLEWRLVEGGPSPSREALLAATDGRVPAGADVASGGDAYYLLRGQAAITGDDLRDARTVRDDYGRPAVAFTLTPDAALRFGRLTGEHVGRRLAIVLDGRVRSAPQIEGRIDRGTGTIAGAFTDREAADLALVLRSGALPASMTYLGGGVVGPSLGAAAIHAGIVASLAGLGLVAAFMLLYYNRAGLNALVAVAVNLVLLLGLMAYAGAALTLPGIAGFILTIGMGVDSNVLIFERIKEELAAGRTARAAVAAGFDRVFLTILDTHIASLIAAAFLFQFGTGTIRGFAATLTFGLLSNVFTSVFVSRTLFELTLGRTRGARLRLATVARPARMPVVNWYRWRWAAGLLSAVTIAAGFGVAAARGGIPLGIDFTGGTVVTVKFAGDVADDRVRAAIPGDPIVQQYGDRSEHTVMIRVATPEGPAARTEEQAVDDVVGALRSAGVPPFDVMGSETIGPSIGADLRRKGVFATVSSIAGITAYIALRFRPSFAAGAVAATLHDVLVTGSLLAGCGYDLTLNVVAAVLTITGYSVNDTIVIFDRVRENVRAMPGVPLQEVVNASVNQTLGRTVITAGTALLAVLALFFFGGDVLHGFAFAMLVGIVSGTYSTVFIASAIAVMLGRRRGAARPLPDLASLKR